MIGLFESLARQALDHRPEIVPLEPRSVATRAAVDSLEFLPAAGDISWAELHPAFHQTGPSSGMDSKSMDTRPAAEPDRDPQRPNPISTPMSGQDTSDFFAHFAEEQVPRIATLDGIHTSSTGAFDAAESIQSIGDTTHPPSPQPRPEPPRDSSSVKSVQSLNLEVHLRNGSRIGFSDDGTPRSSDTTLARAAIPLAISSAMSAVTTPVPQTVPAIDPAPHLNSSPNATAGQANQPGASVPQSRKDVERVSAADRASIHAPSSLDAVAPIAYPTVSPLHASTTQERAIHQAGPEVLARPVAFASLPATPEEVIESVGAPQRAISTASEAGTVSEDVAIPEGSPPVAFFDERPRSSPSRINASSTQTAQSPEEPVDDVVAPPRTVTHSSERKPTLASIIALPAQEEAKTAGLAGQIERQGSQRQVAAVAHLGRDLSASAPHPQTHEALEHPEDWSRTDPGTPSLLSASPKRDPLPTSTAATPVRLSVRKASGDKIGPSTPSAVDPAIARENGLEEASPIRAQQPAAMPQPRPGEAFIADATPEADHFLHPDHTSNVRIDQRPQAQSSPASADSRNAASHNQQTTAGPTPSVAPISGVDPLARPVPDAPPPTASHPAISARQSNVSRPAATSAIAADPSRKSAPSRLEHPTDAPETHTERKIDPVRIPPRPPISEFFAAGEASNHQALSFASAQKESVQAAAHRTSDSIPEPAPASGSAVESQVLLAVRHATADSHISASKRVPDTAPGTGKPGQAPMMKERTNDRRPSAPSEYRAAREFRSAKVGSSHTISPPPPPSVDRPAPEGDSQPQEGSRSTVGNPHRSETVDKAGLFAMAPATAQNKGPKRADTHESQEDMVVRDRSNLAPQESDATGWRPLSGGSYGEITDSRQGKALPSVDLYAKTKCAGPLPTAGTSPIPSPANPPQRAVTKLSATSFFQAKSSSSSFPTNRRTVADSFPSPPAPVRISIGRIAIETPQTGSKRAGRPKPQLSLGQYLNRREGGGR